MSTRRYQLPYKTFNDPVLVKKLTTARARFYSSKKKPRIKSKPSFFQKLSSNEFVVPKTAFEENYFHGYNFKNMPAFTSTKAKLEYLVEMSSVKLKYNAKVYKTRRKNKRRGVGKCEVCTENKATCQHHIILLINGGYDNGINRINICNVCHIKIHPWMGEK